MPPNSEARATVIPRFMNMYRKAEETVNIQIGVFRDTDWDTIADTKKIACDVKKQKAMKVMDIEIPVDGTWGKQHNITFGNQNIPKIFYFVAMDCEHNTHSKAKTMPKIELEVTVVQVLSFGEVDHFSYEEDGTLTLHLFLLILFSAIFGMTVYSYYEYQKQYERYDSPHFIMALALFMQMGAIFMQTLHLWMYSHNGRGIPIFDIFGLIGCMLSEITVSCLMMMIAHGWTIIYQDIDFDNNIEIYLPVGAIVVAVHLVLAAMTYIDLDAHHKYHDFSGVQGWVLIIFKLGLFLYFLYCVCQNIDKIPKRSMKFHRVFTILAIVYLLSECKNMARARRFGIPTPALYLIDEGTRRIYMEYLGNNAITVKDFLYQLKSYDHPILEQLVDKIGTYIAILHSNDQIHGDLTTSNMMIKPKQSMQDQLIYHNNNENKISPSQIAESGVLGDVYIIDFGLSFVSGKIEDKAVDIYVLKRAFISTHPGSEELFEKILLKYKEKGQKSLQIIAKYHDVEKRGRKRECFG